MSETFDEAFAVEMQQFAKQDYSDIFKADGPFDIYGLKDTKSRVEGQLYQTKEKKVLITVFLGILSREDNKFGRIVMFSSGVPGSTVKVEFPTDDIALMGCVSVVADSDETDANARDYYRDFLVNVTRELNFQDGLVVPQIDDRMIVLRPLASAPPKRASSSSSEDEEDDREAKKAWHDPLECMVCLDAEPQTMVLPCMHRVVCEPCSHLLRDTAEKAICIYCRSEIKGISCDSEDYYSA